MPPSGVSGPGEAEDRQLAIAAEALFLANLLIAPGLAFLVLAWLWRSRRGGASRLARCHLDQAFWVSLWGGGLLVLASLVIVLLGGIAWAWTWVSVILYFTCVHSTLILIGMFGLSRAMAGREFVYPLIGVRGE